MLKRQVLFLLIFFNFAGINVSAGENEQKLSESGEMEYLKGELLEFKELFKYEQPELEIPAFISIVTAEEITRYGYRNLMDIFRAVSGMYVSYDRTYGTVGIRGFSRAGDFNSRMLLLINGNPVNDNIYGAVWIEEGFPVDPEIIERIEIAKGTGTLHYGVNAILAVVNVVTKKGAQIEGMTLTAEKHDFRKSKAIVTGGKAGSGWDVMVSGSLIEDQGHETLRFPEYAGNNEGGTARNNDSEHAFKTCLNARYGDFRVQAGFSSRSKQIPTASYHTVFGSTGEKIHDVQGFTEIKFSRKIGHDATFTGRAYLNYSGEDGYYPYVNSLSDYYLNIDEMDASVLGAELRFDFKLHKNNRMFLGFEFMHTWLTIANYDKEPSGSALKNCLGRDEPCVDINKAYTSFSVFGLDEIRLLSNLIFTIRLRYDNYGDAYDDFQSITLPSLSMVWLMTDSSALKFSYSEACRAPSIYEANYDDSGISMSKNPKLRPEKIKSYEAVYQHKLTEDFSAKIGFFYYDISGLIDQDRFFSEEGEIIQYRNMGDITMEGVEFETGGFITDFIHGSFSWTFQQAKDSEGKSLPNSPAENGKLRFSMPLYMDRIFSGIEFLYLGARKTAAGRDLDPYLLANLTFSIQNIYRTLSISASIYNLFDVRYYDAVSLDQYPIDSILQDGISFRLKASYTF